MPHNCNSDSDSCDSNNNLVSLYDRLLIISADANLGVGYVPPPPSAVIAAVLDPNHAGMISSGLYTSAEVIAFQNAAIAYFNATFGLNFNLGTTDPTTGIITLVSVSPAYTFIMVPYKAGQDNSLHVAFDSAHPHRGENGKWYGYQYGVLVVPENNGIFIGGSHAGDTYVAGDILTVFDYNLIKLGHPHRREIIHVQSPWTGKNIPNSQGYSDFLAKCEAIDEQNRVGFYDETIVYIKDVVTNIVYSKTRVVITWPEH